MPELRRLAAAEADRFFPKRGQMDLSEYERFLSALKTGDAGEARVADGETVRAIKRRLTVAAKSQGKALQYSKRAPEGTIVFRVK